MNIKFHYEIETAYDSLINKVTIQYFSGDNFLVTRKLTFDYALAVMNHLFLTHELEIHSEMQKHVIHYYRESYYQSHTNVPYSL